MINSQLVEIYSAAIAAAGPHRAVLEAVAIQDGQLRVDGAAYNLDAYRRILVIGAGKASAGMAQAMEELLGDRISAGLVIVKDGHKAELGRIEQVEASHPVPDGRGMDATARLLNMVQGGDARTLIICLISGGASSLLVKPVEALTLRDIQEVNEALLASGAAIREVNAVRKHLSAIKGAGLARAAFPAEMLTLIISDVIGNHLDTIASGPTVGDSTTFSDAIAVIEKYGLQSKMPLPVMQYLARGVAGEVRETLKPGDPILSKTRNILIGSIGHALHAARVEARKLGYATETLTEELQGNVGDAAKLLAGVAQQAQQSYGQEWRCILSGGETTVRVQGSGKGGRNQALALAFALEIEGWQDIHLLSAATDGTDGPTDAAGAIVDTMTAKRARLYGMDPLHYLENNDSYSFFHQFDVLSGEACHFITGPTGTNVMDIQIMLVRVMTSRDRGH